MWFARKYAPELTETHPERVLCAQRTLLVNLLEAKQTQVSTEFVEKQEKLKSTLTHVTISQSESTHDNR